jgi:prepilin-type N-terminal cleavage/methylation domain-containing protein/prepilin-type processing-associated H-X9-DG protein
MQKNGFTLLELLVVIAIIALLAGIIFPSLVAAKMRAKSTICSSNQRQISFAFLMYKEQTGYYPFGFSDYEYTILNTPPLGSWPGSGSDRKGWWWFNYLQDSVYLNPKQGSVLWCPSRSVSPTFKLNILCINYGVNRSVCPNNPEGTTSPFASLPKKSEELRKPAGTLLLGDSGYSLLSWQAATNTASPVYENPARVNLFYIPGLKRNQTRNELAANRDAIRGRHPGQTLNLIFADGHSETRPAEFLEVGPNVNSLRPPWSP